MPKRIVHVAPRYPPAIGGMERVVQALARYQHDAGADVEVLTSDEGARGTDPHVQPEPFSVRRLHSIEVAHTPVIPGLIPALARLGRNAFIHLHVCSAFTPEAVWLVARLADLNYVAHVHLDVLPSGPAGFLLEPYKQVLWRRVLRGAAAVVVPTPDYLGLISAKYRVPSQRIKVLGNGTDHALRSAPRSLPPGTRTRRLLFVGRLSPQKNIPLMLEAMASYIHRYTAGITLSIVGDGEAKDEILAQIDRLGLATVVMLRGILRGSDLEAAYEDADLLLLTSLNESFGLALIEGMTKALPIVSVDIPAVRNVVTQGVNGALVEPTPVAVADAIHKLLTDNSFYTEVSANNLAAAGSYSWSMIVRDTFEIYDAVQQG